MARVQAREQTPIRPDPRAESQRALRVLYLVPQPHSSQGLSRYTFVDEEIRGLVAAGVQPYVLSTKCPDDYASDGIRMLAVPRLSLGDARDTLRFAAKHFSRLPKPSISRVRTCLRVLRIERFAAELVRRHDIDIIHSHFGWPHGLGGRLASLDTGRPLIASLRGTDLNVNTAIGYGKRNDPWWDINVRQLLPHAERTIYFSEFMQRAGLELGARADRSRLIRKGVDLSRFSAHRDRQSLRRELNLPDRPTVLAVAGLVPVKGVDVALRAVARLKPRFDFTFLIAGVGSGRRDLEALSRSLGIEEQTRFLGRVPRTTVADYFGACDVFVLGSRLEAAPNVVFEAMACGRPVVCTDAGGSGEYVRDGETGFVVPVEDVEAMSDRIARLLTSPDRAVRMGLAGHAYAQQELSFPRMIADIRRVYDEVDRVRQQAAEPALAFPAAESR